MYVLNSAQKYTKRLSIRQYCSSFSGDQNSLDVWVIFAISMNSNGVKDKTNESENNELAMGGCQKSANDTEKKQ